MRLSRATFGVYGLVALACGGRVDRLSATDSGIGGASGSQRSSDASRNQHVPPDASTTMAHTDSPDASGEADSAFAFPDAFNLFGPPADSSGSDPTLAHLTGPVQAVAMDDETLYFALDDGSVYRIPKDGSGTATALVVATTYPSVAGLAVDGSDVYFTMYTDETDGTVNRVPKGGGAVETLARAQVAPEGLTLDDTRVYWVDMGHIGVDASEHDGSIMALAKSGGPLTILASGEQVPDSILLAGRTLVWIDTPSGGGNAAIRTLSLNLGGAPTSIASSLDYATQPVVASDGRVYWLDVSGATGSPLDVPLSGGTIQMHAVPMGATALATFGAAVYYTDGYLGAVHSMALGGGVSVDVAPALVQGLVTWTPAFLLADAQHLFVFDGFVGSGAKQGRIRAYDRPAP